MNAARRWILASLAGALLACSGEGRPPDAAPPNVILVVVDTLRADALGAYGGPIATPTLDRLAAEGALFEHAFAPTPATAPSHATLFTGQEVPRHGLLRNGDPLAEAAETLAEAFARGGWHTAAFVSSFVLDPRFGWAQGFAHYDAALPDGSATMKKSPYPGAFWAAHRFEGFDRRATATTRAALTWLRDAPEPFFAFLHYFDPHAPYVAPKPYRERVAGTRFDLRERALPGVPPERLEDLVRRYHAEVAYTDESIGALLAALAERSGKRSTLLVLTADHGEGLGQHGWLEHAVHLYDEQIRVPLLLHWPGRIAPGQRFSTPVGLVDVAPTIAELVGLPALAGADGRSLAASLRDGREPAPRPVFGDRHLVAEETGWGHGTKSSLRTREWKYIRSSDGREELYDLAADPGELRDLGAARRDVAEALGGLLAERVAATPGSEPAPPVSEETRRALRALGYAE